MALNNLGLGIGINVTGNAIQGFSGIGRVFGRFSSMLPRGIGRFGKLNNSISRTGDQFSSLNKLFPPVSGRLGRLTGRFGRFSSKLSHTFGKLGKLKGMFTGLGKEFSNFSSLLPPGMSKLTGIIKKFGPLGVGIAALTFGFIKLVSAISKGIENLSIFEKGMSEVSTLLSDTDMKIMPVLEWDILDLSVKYGKTIEDMTKATYQAISASVAVQDVGKFLGVAGKLAIGGVTDMETAVDGLTSIKNAFGLSMDEMIDVSDKMFVAMRAGKTTIAELSQSIGQVAPIAATLQIPLKDVLAMAATLTKGGLATSETITAIRQTMIEVMRQTPKFVKTAKQYSIQYDIATVRAMGFAKWLSYVNKRLVSQGGKLTDMFRSVQGLTGSLVLVNKGMKDNAKVLKDMGSSTDQTRKAYEKMVNTYEFKMARLAASSRAASVELGKFFMPMAKAWADMKINFFEGMTEMFRNLNILIKAMSGTLTKPEIRRIRIKELKGMIETEKGWRTTELKRGKVAGSLSSYTLGLFGDAKEELVKSGSKSERRIRQYQLQIDALMKKGVKDGLTDYQNELDKRGKRPPPVRINNVISLGNKKLHDSQADWELEFLMRNFIPVY